MTAVVLCGGTSRRMGRDKALLRIGPGTLLERAVELVEPLVGEVVLACGPEPRYGELGRRLALDGIPDGGPLTGLAAGLAAARTEWVLALACDMPGLERGLLEGLLAAAAEGVDVVAFADGRGDEPLCALYRPKSALPRVWAALAAGERRANCWWDRPGEDGRCPVVVRLPKPDPLAADSPAADPPIADTTECADPFRNLNTPEDVSREEARSFDEAPSMRPAR